jgi:hypothetical protein
MPDTLKSIRKELQPFNKRVDSIKNLSVDEAGEILIRLLKLAGLSKEKAEELLSHYANEVVIDAEEEAERTQAFHDAEDEYWQEQSNRR